jgi:Kef-type K+ transport system membrane component KefB
MLILQIAAIIIAARVIGRLFRAVGQPQVVGEMVAGLVLGPSVFGAVSPELFARVFPTDSLDTLNALSQVGLLLFMFMIGLELDTQLLRGRTRAALLISQAGIAVPFFLGLLLANPLHDVFAPAGVGRLGFSLFMGIAMSITAFPVLARILRERNLLGTKLGAATLASAAVDDVMAWTGLAIIIMVVRAGGQSVSIPVMVGGTLAFVVFMVAVVRPLLRRWSVRWRETPSQDVIAVMLVLALISAWITETLGIHALFGAFLAGAVVPAHQPIVQETIRKLEDLVVVFLVPLFFAFAGLRASVGLLEGAEQWGYTLVIIVVAIAGKLGGCGLAARISGMPWREATALGVLMNTRGLMELVVLNIGLDIGVIGPDLYTMMVIMAIVTTFLTTPLLAAIGMLPKRLAVESPVSRRRSRATQ